MEAATFYDRLCKWDFAGNRIDAFFIDCMDRKPRVTSFCAAFLQYTILSVKKLVKIFITSLYRLLVKSYELQCLFQSETLRLSN